MWTPSTGAFRNHPQSGIFQYGSVWTWRIYPPNGSIKSGGYRIGRHTHNIRSYWRVFSWRVEAKLEIRSCGENNVMSHKPPMTGHGLYYTSYMTYIYLWWLGDGKHDMVFPQKLLGPPQGNNWIFPATPTDGVHDSISHIPQLEQIQWFTRYPHRISQWDVLKLAVCYGKWSIYTWFAYQRWWFSIENC